MIKWRDSKVRTLKRISVAVFCCGKDEKWCATHLLRIGSGSKDSELRDLS